LRSPSSLEGSKIKADLPLVFFERRAVFFSEFFSEDGDVSLWPALSVHASFTLTFSPPERIPDRAPSTTSAAPGKRMLSAGPVMKDRAPFTSISDVNFAEASLFSDVRSF